MSSPVMVLSPICLGNFSYKKLISFTQYSYGVSTIPRDVCECVCACACVREILVLNFNSQENSVLFRHY